MLRVGFNWSFSETHPTRIITVVAFSAALENRGVAQIGQKTWARRLPLCEILMYSLTSPVNEKFSIVAATPARRGAPDRIWQSVQ